MKRPVWAWLLLVLWVEIDALLVWTGYCNEKLMLVEMTNLVSAVPSGEWWIVMSNMAILVLGIGCVLWWFKRYGVMVGLAIFVLGIIGFGL